MHDIILSTCMHNMSVNNSTIVKFVLIQNFVTVKINLLGGHCMTSAKNSY